MAAKVLQVLKRAESVLLGEDGRADGIDASRAYLDLLLQETLSEAHQRSEVENDAELSEEAREKALEKVAEQFYYRRIINSAYFKQLKTLILSGDYD